jgi:Putative Flp pilus-assembly TadE/G-like
MSVHKTSRKNKSQSRESGQAAIFLVLAMGLFLIGSMGFVVDGANLWFHRQSAQTAADAACTAGAVKMLSVAAGATPPDPNWIGTSFQCSGSTSGAPNNGFAPCQYAAFNGYTSSGLKANQAGSDVSVTFPGSFASMPSCPNGANLCTAESIAATPYIQVNVTDRVQTTFIGMLNGGHTVDVGAQAMCGLSNVLSAVPVLVLNPNAPNTPAKNTMNADGNSNLTVLNGPQKSIQVNSSSSSAVDLSAAVISLSGDFSVAARESMSDANGSNLNWVEAAGVISDPFAAIDAPQKPAQDCSGINCIQYASNPGDVADCPSNASCDIYQPGYYPIGISVQKGGGPNGNASGLAVFEPGIYYLDGDFAAGPHSCLRPSPATGVGGVGSGTLFYLHGGHTLSVSPQSGELKQTKAKANFACQTDQVPLSALQCNSNSVLPAPLSSGVAGNVLLGPCNGTYGDPLGSGNQRGMLFFQDRDTPAPQPTWSSKGSFALIGNLYFHYCNSTSSTNTGSGANCDQGAFTDTFNLANPSSKFGDPPISYIVGNIVVDQLQLGQSNGTSPITVSLNPNPQYYVLKASLLQ